MKEEGSRETRESKQSFADKKCSETAFDWNFSDYPTEQAFLLRSENFTDKPANIYCFSLIVAFAPLF